MTDALPPVASAWPVASDVRPAPLPAQPVALPAREAFAAAIFDAAARDRAERPLAEAVANPVGIAPPVAAASIGHADSRPIDMAAAHWPVAMIDRIERLRDEADASDTRIRLVPDALGSVEVAVRQVGDAVHVHFTAAEPETRQLLADAQGQLARAAEERGVRLGPTEVSSGPSGGGTGGGHRHPDAQGRPLPGRPRPAPSQAPEPSTGERLSTRIA